MKRYLLVTVALIGILCNCVAQSKELRESWLQQRDSVPPEPLKLEYLDVKLDRVIEVYTKQPAFGMYKENYFITGIPTNKPANRHNSDAKFQISIRQKLFNNVKPLDAQLFLIYTQKSFWDLYKESLPFADNNYNPGLLLTKPFVKNSQLKGMLTLSLEHESNGKDSLENRSWNYFTISGTHYFNMYFTIQAKLWYGWLSDENSDLFDYRGYGLLALNYRSFNDRFGVSFLINPRKNFSMNTQLELSYKINRRSNQHIFLQWHNGYGEGLLNYDKYTSMVRIGISLKPPLRDIH